MRPGADVFFSFGDCRSGIPYEIPDVPGHVNTFIIRHLKPARADGSVLDDRTRG